jgi:hypothetical protein
MFLNLFIKDAYSNLLFNAKKAKKIGKSKIKIEFKKKKSKHQLSLLDVILNAIERKKTSCFYEVIGAENYEKVKREAIWKGYDVKDAGFLRKSNLKNDPNGTFTMEVSW